MLNFLAANHLNWVDLAIVIVLAFYLLEGYGVGLIGGMLDLGKFILSLVLGLKFYLPIAGFLTKFFGLSSGVSHVIGFFSIVFLLEFGLTLALAPIVEMIHRLFWDKRVLRLANNILGILPGFISGALLLIFILAIIMALPVSPLIKTAVNSSNLGQIALSQSQIFESQVQSVFGGVNNEMINFLTVEPDSNSLVKLNFSTDKWSIDTLSEQQMFKMVNQERLKRGIPALVLDTNLLQQIARAHGEDMFSRGYFSHFTPEGLSPFDRMAKVGIQYQYAGENLAFSQSVELAMQGLMNSPGHRANILSVNFKRVGIGVIDGGVYGKMFVQDFTD